MLAVFGLDLSLTSTGIADSTGARTITTKLRGMERIEYIRGAIEDTLLLPSLTTLVVIEDYAFHGHDSYAHALGELGGVVRWWLHQTGVPYVNVLPSVLKKYATGKGNAPKDLMLATAIRKLGYEGHSNDEADALFLRAMGMDALGCPVVKLPAENRKSLEKVTWPVRASGESLFDAPLPRPVEDVVLP
jgi:Holliday junction resolvasome RuvABC endonuclease subunit